MVQIFLSISSPKGRRVSHVCYVSSLSYGLNTQKASIWSFLDASALVETLDRSPSLPPYAIRAYPGDQPRYVTERAILHSLPMSPSGSPTGHWNGGLGSHTNVTFDYLCQSHSHDLWNIQTIRVILRPQITFSISWIKSSLPRT